MLADWWNNEGRWMNRAKARAILLSLARVMHPDKWAVGSAGQGRGVQADHAGAQRILEREATAYTADTNALLAMVRC